MANPVEKLEELVRETVLTQGQRDQMDEVLVEVQDVLVKHAVTEAQVLAVVAALITSMPGSGAYQAVAGLVVASLCGADLHTVRLEQGKKRKECGDPNCMSCAKKTVDEMVH